MKHEQHQANERLISSSGFRKVSGPPGSPFTIIVIDRRGRPVSYLSEWYRRRQEPGPNRTRQTYLSMLFPVMSFWEDHGYLWTDPPERIRTYLAEFLRERLTCRIQPDQDREGYWVETSRTSPLSKSGLGVMLAAIKDFYRVMGDAGYYAHPSPMTSHLLESWRRERAHGITAAGAPDHAGIRSESWEESRRHPTAYFRQGKRQQWQPKIAMESADVRERMWNALISMTQHAATQRDRVVLLLLRHTGARLHEILGMTAGGYRKATDPLQAFVVNKGSLRREEKRITLLDTDEEALWKYLRGERAQYDPLGRTQLAELDAHDSLFLTARRKPYGDAAFRYHWNRLMAHAQQRYHVCFTPHAVRHLFVTQHLLWIKEAAGDDKEEQQRLKAGLVHIMGWHSRATMQIYDHTFSLQEAVDQLHAFQRQAENQTHRHAQSAAPEPYPATTCEEVEVPHAFVQLWEDTV